MITRELFEEWKSRPVSRQESALQSAVPVHGDSLITSTESTGMIAVDQMASEIRLAEETAESGKDSLPIASDVVVALASPLGMTGERETKARANQS